MFNSAISERARSLDIMSQNSFSKNSLTQNSPNRERHQQSPDLVTNLNIHLTQLPEEDKDDDAEISKIFKKKCSLSDQQKPQSPVQIAQTTAPAQIAQTTAQIAQTTAASPTVAPPVPQIVSEDLASSFSAEVEAPELAPESEPPAASPTLAPQGHQIVSGDPEPSVSAEVEAPELAPESEPPAASPAVAPPAPQIISGDLAPSVSAQIAQTTAPAQIETEKRKREITLTLPDQAAFTSEPTSHENQISKRRKIFVAY